MNWEICSESPKVEGVEGPDNIEEYVVKTIINHPQSSPSLGGINFNYKPMFIFLWVV